ncbi:hypothetical protein [Flavobacterium hibernum]|uniref:Polysaccharide polymerase n=1 Tax=Flavobacterium hibernum TaxID=37752 RepID=A0A0D0F3H6_9FLAO|nr:hypothetical protein [Flavobacterium hibernum]KIO54181.1 hypothetical protein IW18_04060 [Flavobacterium hibernum]OXA89714.1 hypothetical protein B0A73_04855 [Flavobacterium hibernum]STO13897.1 Uncharacterised protein [Flavobacterium hibernum]
MAVLKRLFFSLFFLFALLTLSLYVFRLIGYSFSFAFFLLGLLIILSLKYIPTNSWRIYFLLLIHQYIVLVLFVFELDFIEFLKSFLLVNIALLAILSSKFHIPRAILQINFKAIFSFAACIIVFYELIQVLEYNLMGTSFSWFFLDKYSISTAEDVGRFQAVNFLDYMRPISLYHEPSYLGLVLFSMLIWGDSVKIKLEVKLLIILGIILSFSTTIYLFMVLYYIPKLYNNKYVKVFFCLFVVYFIIKYNITIFEFFRFNEIATEGTSGYARIGAPFFQVIDIIFYQHNFFGIPFGQSPIMFDNSFFVIFSYYGILTPLFYLLIFGSVFKNVKEYNKLFDYFLIVGACLFVNGAFFTPETSFLIVITNYILLNNLTFNKEKL